MEGGWGERRGRTVAPGSCFVVQVVAHHGGCVVQQVGDLLLALAVEGLLQQVDIVAPAGLDEDLAHGSALLRSAEILLCPSPPQVSPRAAYLVLLLVRHGGEAWGGRKRSSSASGVSGGARSIYA